jgi:hypothetical protein
VSRLVGVHGIAQQQLGRHQLQAPWARALADGMERSAGRPISVPALDVAFYGDLFLSAPVGGGAKGFDSDGGAAWDDVTDAEINDLIAAAGEVLSEDDLSAAARDAPRKGFGRVPLSLQAMVAGLDRRFGAHASVLFVGELRQVRRYLLDPELKTEVEARVAETVGEECRILIGHSLGSVVAFEFLRQHPERRLDQLITLGSPLGLRAIRHLMPDPEFGSEGVPGSVDAWVNLRDLRDPVACAGSLAGWWPGIREGIVDNQKSAHSAERYLSKKETGDAVLSVAPELAS